MGGIEKDKRRRLQIPSVGRGLVKPSYVSRNSPPQPRPVLYDWFQKENCSSGVTLCMSVFLVPSPRDVWAGKPKTACGVKATVRRRKAQKKGTVVAQNEGGDKAPGRFRTAGKF